MARTQEKTANSLDKNKLIAHLAKETGLTRKQIRCVFDALHAIIRKSLTSQEGGQFVFPGLIKITRKVVAAKPRRDNVPNPFKPGETMNIPAKPASAKIAIRALKRLKEITESL